MRNGNIKEGQQVFVYYNLHKKCLSVQNKDRIVIRHCQTAALKGATFMVSESGRQKVLRDHQKNVHARIKGAWALEDVDISEARKVRYNPYLFSTFVYAETEEPVLKAPIVTIIGKDIWVIGE